MMQTSDFLEILLRDFTVGSTYLITFILLMIGWGFYKKSTGRTDSTFGLAVYFFTFAIYCFSTNTEFLYPEFFEYISLSFIGSITWIVGIIVLIYTVETDLMKEERKLPLVTIFSVVQTLVVLLMLNIGIRSEMSFIGLSVAIVYVTYGYIRKVMQLEIARETFPQVWFAVGLTLSGFANFIILFIFEYEGFLLKSILILVGALCVNYSWRGIPSAADLDWLLALDRLLIIESETSLPLIDFTFKTLNGIDSSEKDGMLIAGAIGGISSLIGEILADSGGLDEIEYGSRTILFHHRKDFTVMLVAESSMRELRYRLESLGISFENEYGERVAEFDGTIDQFKDATKLIRDIFS
ncbi:MAG: hypothetical protein ACTSV2_16520 [Candidatus Thorarchaeota archaeon]